MSNFTVKISLLAFLLVPGLANAVQVQLTPIADTTLYEDTEGDLANGSGDFLFFGRVGSSIVGDEKLRRSLVRFDVSSIPREAIIDSVTLQFEINFVPMTSAAGGFAALHRLTSSWGEGSSHASGNEGQGGAAATTDATWIHRFFPGTNWGAVGGDFVGTASVTEGYGLGLETLTFDSTVDLRADVKSWLIDPASNHGWILLGNESLPYSARRVYSRESVAFEVPQLTVEYTVPSPTDNLDLTEVAMGLTRPVAIANANDGSGRLFIVEQAGLIRIFDTNTQALLATPYLDISSIVDDVGNEQGLLGLAFHPDFSNNKQFYVYYIRDPGPGQDISVVARHQQNSGDPNIADTPGTVLMEFPQNDANHNGGDLHFGPDGYLYIASGDGGGANDIFNNAQNINSLKGKMLRIDVDGTPGTGGSEFCGDVENYAIPPGNAFPGSSNGCDEILHLGLRNPWKFSFDALTGEMYIGDVGQGEWEEVDNAAPGASGINFGWPCREGAHPFRNDVTCPNAVDPIIEYSSGSGSGNCSITGGYVYRGSQAAIYGYYVYGDYCSDRIWLARNEGGSWGSTLWDEAASTLSSLTAFGQDEQCELYVADLDAGKIFRIDDTNSVHQSGFESLSCR